MRTSGRIGAERERERATRATCKVATFFVATDNGKFEMRRVGKEDSEGAAGWRIRMVTDMGMEVEGAEEE